MTMMSFHRWVIGVSLWLLAFQELVLPGVDGFVVGVGGRRRSFSNRVVVDTTQSPSFFSWHLFQAAQDEDTTTDNDNDPLADLSEERKANLFQFLLRDLEVENVPLLGCDATQAHVVQAALWTTMAELSDKATQDKACLIFENIPVDALKRLVDDFMELKNDNDDDDDGILNHLPELERLSLSLVGKGVGPAILIETVNATDKTQTPESSIMTNNDDDMEALELKVTAAMKSFVDRMMANKGEEVESGPIAYRIVPSANICDVLAGFWSCVCELLALPDEELSTIILSLPGLISDDDEKARFAAISTLISRSLFVYQGQDVLDLQYMHPTYDRTAISPVDRPAYGHLPPLEWIPAMLKQQDEDGKELSKEDIALSNFQRRSPVPAVIMRRVSQLDAAETATVDLDFGDGRIEKASGCATYTRNAIRLAAEGKEALQSALDAEICITSS